MDIIVSTVKPVVLSAAAPLVLAAEPITTVAAPLVLAAEPIIAAAAFVVSAVQPVVVAAAPVLSVVKPLALAVTPVVAGVIPTILTTLPLIAALRAQKAQQAADALRAATRLAGIKRQHVEKLAEATRVADKEREQAEKDRKDAEETMQRMENERMHAEEAMREAREVGRRVEEEMTACAEAARREEVEAKRREEAAGMREEEAQRLAEEAKRREEEARSQAEASVRQAQEAQQQSDEAQRQAEEAKRRAEDQWMRGIPPEFRPTEEIKQKFRQQYGIQDDKINIAIVGESGMGKSSLLNALRGLSPRDAGAAPSGINETTIAVQGYPDLRNPNIVWYDVPGANTPTVQGWMYFAEQGLFVFNVMVVVFADRFTQTTGTLISNANKCSIPTFLVRTKADQLVQNMKSDYDDDDEPLSDDDARAQVITVTHKMVSDNLARLKLPRQPVYIVSKLTMKKLVTKGDMSSVIDEKRILDDVLHLGLTDISETDADLRLGHVCS